MYMIIISSIKFPEFWIQGFPSILISSFPSFPIPFEFKFIEWLNSNGQFDIVKLKKQIKLDFGNSFKKMSSIPSISTIPQPNENE